MKINKKLISVNHTQLRRSKRDIQWIVIHYVGALGDARANCAYYGSGYVGASADFFVGHTGDIWQANDYYNFYSWHCGGGYQSNWTKNGSGKYYGICTNRNSIGIEMCVHKRSTRTMNAMDSDWYFEPATEEAAAELVAYLMRELDIDIDHVITHNMVNRKICPNPYVLDYGKWRGFLAKVSFYAAGAAPAPTPVTEQQWYRVRTSWDNERSQLGAYESLENAKKNCPAGYQVYDSTGKSVYKPSTAKSGTQAAAFGALTESAAAARLLELARVEGKRSGILPSVIAAQAILESGYCKTELATKGNNLFGMKTKLSGNSWPTVWDGVSKVNIRTAEEYKPGVITYEYADFRKYPNIEKAFEDHSNYLLFSKDGSDLRYKGLTACKNYKEAIRLIKDGGYATDTKYVSKICSIIERFSLDKYDYDMPKTIPEKAVSIAKEIEADNSHGYNNAANSRGGNPDYACSSFVADCYIKSGVIFGKKCNEIYTKDMKDLFQRAGFIDVTAKVNLKTGAGLEAGDVLLKPGSHTEIYAGNGKIIGARGNAQSGKPENGKPGDQTGGEISEATYYNLPWTVVLRYTGKTEPEPAVKTMYRVQVGAYQRKGNADKLAKKLNDHGFSTFTEAKNGTTYLYCGSYSTEANARARVAELGKIGVNAIIKNFLN